MTEYENLPKNGIHVCRLTSDSVGGTSTLGSSTDSGTDIFTINLLPFNGFNRFSYHDHKMQQPKKRLLLKSTFRNIDINIRESHTAVIGLLRVVNVLLLFLYGIYALSVMIFYAICGKKKIKGKK